jgi:putative copper export protein
MEFMIWATRSVHVFSAVVWLGGLLYMGGILYPVFQYEKMTTSQHYVRIERRFIGFVWMCVWTTAITGVFLMLFSPRFVLGQYRSEWDILLLLKQCLYLVMVGIVVTGVRIVKKMESLLLSSSPGELEHRLIVQHQKMLTRRRINLALGIILLLISTRLAAH